MFLGMMLLLLAVADDRPPLWLANLLPDKQICWDILQFNNAHHIYLRACRDVWQTENWDAAVHRNSKHNDFWYLAYRIRSGGFEGNPSPCARDDLRRIIVLIGWDNFMAQRFPLPIPVYERD